MKKVAIIHPWFPQYRQKFFEQLVEVAYANGVSIDIFHGAPPPEWGERGDSVSSQYAIPLKTRFFRLGGKSFVLKSVSDVASRAPYDVIVLEQAVRNLETYRILFAGKRLAHKIAFWGHGRTYTTKVSLIQEWLKNYLTLKTSWFFAYTGGGAEAVINLGFDPNRVTVVQNSVDTKGIQTSMSSISNEAQQAFRAKYSLTSKVALYMGGLDEAKRISFLLDAGTRAHELDSEFRLVVVGSGKDRKLVEDASEKSPWLTYLGPLFGAEKALALSAASLMLMPGRVGLVAVDSFAAGLPIVTTQWPWHAPEFEYLTHGINAVITDDDLYEYSNEVVGLLNDEDRLARLQRGAKEATKEYSVELMVSKFWTGIQQILS